MKYLDCISVENMRESDRMTIEKYVLGRTLMYRAAMGVFRAVSWHGEIVIAVGGGNNGGDGYALACILRRNDFTCRIVKLSEKLTDDSGYYASRLNRSTYLVKPIRAERLPMQISLSTVCSVQAFRALYASRGSAR